MSLQRLFSIACLVALAACCRVIGAPIDVSEPPAASVSTAPTGTMGDNPSEEEPVGSILGDNACDQPRVDLRIIPVPKARPVPRTDSVWTSDVKIPSCAQYAQGRVSCVIYVSESEMRGPFEIMPPDLGPRGASRFFEAR